jgi:uncharacterized protein YndB with AHSA1/START domain
MDRLEKQMVLRAPRARVWRALTNAKEFGAWFGVKLQGDFAPGKPISGQITYQGMEHLTMTVTVDRLEPEHTFSFYWNPYAIEPGVDYSKEEPTLVEFTLSDSGPSGTLLKVVESGFDRVPLARRAKAFEMNDQGWAEQLRAISEYLQHASE